MKHIALLAVLSAVAAVAATAPHAGCARHEAVTAHPKVRIVQVQSIAALLVAFEPAALIRAMLANSMSAPASAACPHQAQVNAWYAWRHRNPNAHSRYARGNRINTLQLNRVNLVAALNFGNGADPEPSPDPNFGGCGCDEATALASGGCGFWHANVYSFHAVG